MSFDSSKTVADHFKWYYDNKYITARDGNACLRVGSSFLVTASGVRKDDLKWNDFTYVNEKCEPLEDNEEEGFTKKPSIETGAHVAALVASGKQASVHVHSPNTVALAALFDHGNFGPSTRHLVEVMNKKWPELFRYTKVAEIPPFFQPGSQKLHDSIVNCLKYWDIAEVEEDENVPRIGEPLLEEVMKFKDIVILQRHGVLAIGEDMEECRDHIVRLEHISTILLKIVTASGKLESIL